MLQHTNAPTFPAVLVLARTRGFAVKCALFTHNTLANDHKSPPRAIFLAASCAVFRSFDTSIATFPGTMTMRHQRAWVREMDVPRLLPVVTTAILCTGRIPVHVPRAYLQQHGESILLAAVVLVG